MKEQNTADRQLLMLLLKKVDTLQETVDGLVRESRGDRPLIEAAGNNAPHIKKEVTYQGVPNNVTNQAESIAKNVVSITASTEKLSRSLDVLEDRLPPKRSEKERRGLSELKQNFLCNMNVH